MFLMFVVVVGVVLAYVIHLVNASVVQSVSRLANADEVFEEVLAISDVEYGYHIADTKEWALANDFEASGHFLLHTLDSGIPMKCSAWWSEKRKTFLLFYFAENGEMKNTASDFFTRLSEGVSMTTCTSMDGLILPKPELDFIQLCADDSLNERYQVHLKSVAAIGKKRGLKLAAKKGDLLEMIRESLLAQHDYIVSLLLWKLRGAYWYFVRRHLAKSKRY